MQNILKSKIILFFGLFGIAFSLLLSVFSGTSILLIAAKTIIGGFLMGGIGAGLDFFLKRTLSQVEYDSLFLFTEAGPKGKIPEQPLNYKIDVTDETAVNPESAYQDLYKNAAGEDTNNTPEETIPPSQSQSEPYLQETDYPNNEMPHSIDDTVNTQNEENFKTGYGRDSSIEPDSVNIENSEIDRSSNLSEETSSLGEAGREEDLKKQGRLGASSQDKAVSFRLKNKVINADPAIVAKAIRTILHKD